MNSVCVISGLSVQLVWWPEVHGNEPSCATTGLPVRNNELCLIIGLPIQLACWPFHVNEISLCGYWSSNPTCALTISRQRNQFVWLLVFQSNSRADHFASMNSVCVVIGLPIQLARWPFRVNELSSCDSWTLSPMPVNPVCVIIGVSPPPPSICEVTNLPKRIRFVRLWLISLVIQPNP